MTEEHTDRGDERINPDDFDLTVSTALYPHDGDEVALRQMGIGLQPFVILEMSQNDEGGIDLEYTGSMIDSNEELLETLDLFTKSLRAAIEQQAAEVAGEVVEEGA